MLQIGLVTLFSEMFRAFTHHGVTAKAVEKKLIELSFWSPRDYCNNKHKSVDCPPFGGGPGMLMQVEPLFNAVNAAKNLLGENTKVLLLSPQGKRLDQKGVQKLCTYSKFILVCGRYEGVDERFNQLLVDEEWSIGDYVLSGGELPAMVLMDAVSRFIPGVLGEYESACQDSFFDGLLDYPQYAKPREFHGLQVPDVLLSGNHENIRIWRLKQSLGQTWLKRKELLNNLALTDEQQRLLAEFKNEYSKRK